MVGIDAEKRMPGEVFVELWTALGLKQAPNSSNDRVQESLDYPAWIQLESDNESQYARSSGDRRRHPRHDVGGRCAYRIGNQTGYGQAVLHDISQSGLSIGSYQKIVVGRSVTILIETKRPNHLPLMIRATVVRDAGITNDGIFRYGCLIERVTNPNS